MLRQSGLLFKKVTFFGYHRNPENKYVKDAEKLETLGIGENVNWSSLCGKQYGGTSKSEYRRAEEQLRGPAHAWHT
jgi:hypothetical protein